MLTRKEKCYLAIGILSFAAVLVVLALLNVWIMLLVLLLGVVVSGLLFSRKRESMTAGNGYAESDHRRRRFSKRKQNSVPSLILVGESSGDQIVVNRDTFTVGRNVSCNYVVNQPKYISGKHFTIRMDRANKKAFIIDNHSHNGTFVNNNRLTPEVPRALAVGDVVQLGTLRFTVQTAHL